MCIWERVCTFECRCPRQPRHWIPWSLAFRQLSCLTWVLGTELGSLARAVQALNTDLSQHLPKFSFEEILT